MDAVCRQISSPHKPSQVSSPQTPLDDLDDLDDLNYLDYLGDLDDIAPTSPASKPRRPRRPSLHLLGIDAPEEPRNTGSDDSHNCGGHPYLSLTKWKPCRFGRVLHLDYCEHRTNSTFELIAIITSTT